MIKLFHERDIEIDVDKSHKDYESNSDSDSEPSASANSPDSASIKRSHPAIIRFEQLI